MGSRETSTSETPRRQGVYRQVNLLMAVGLIVTIILTYLVQRNISESNVDRDMSQIAANISDEVIDSVKEYPAYRWLLRYWHDHADEMNIEYDVDFWGDTVTEKKCIQLARNNPGMQIEYMTSYDIGRLSAADQKLYAEVVYTWLTNRIDQIKRNYDIDFLYIVMTPTAAGENPYATQFFVISGADQYATRSNEYGDFYLLGTVAEVDESLQNAMHAAVDNARPSQSDGAAQEKADTYVGTGSAFADYYAYIDQISDQAVLVGVTYDLSEIHARVNAEAFQRTMIAAILETLLLLLIMRYMRIYLLSPLKDILSNIRMYTATKDSDTVTRNLAAVLEGRRAIAIRRNEVGELTEDMIGLAHEIDDYVSEIETITTDRERISAELNLASSIQADMLPNVFPPFPERAEFELFASMDPAKEVGGDFYDFFFVDHDHLALVIADVSGKGIPAALFMMASMIITENAAKRFDSPARVLEASNETICTMNRETMFVTMWLGVLELSTGKLTCANAGHECPMIKHADGHFETFRDKHGFVIGAMDGIRYTEYEIELEPGAKVFVYTDGLPEATNADDEMFKVERAVACACAHEDGSPEEILRAMTAAVHEFVGDAEQFDDLTMLCLEYKGAK